MTQLVTRASMLAKIAEEELNIAVAKEEIRQAKIDFCQELIDGVPERLRDFMNNCFGTISPEEILRRGWFTELVMYGNERFFTVRPEHLTHYGFEDWGDVIALLRELQAGWRGMVEFKPDWDKVAEEGTDNERVGITLIAPDTPAGSYSDTDNNARDSNEG